MTPVSDAWKRENSGNRGTGRTRSMIEALPDDAEEGIIIVHNHSVGTYIKNMIQDLRPCLAHLWCICVVASPGDARFLYGCTRFAIDHTFVVKSSANVKAMVDEITGRFEAFTGERI